MANKEQDIEKIVAMLDGAFSEGAGRVKVTIDEEKEDKIQVEKTFGTCNMSEDGSECDIVLPIEE